jgi:hypothetical protein
MMLKTTALALVPLLVLSKVGVAQGPRIVSVAVVPDSVTVGTPFELLAAVSAPRGASVLFPGTPRSDAGPRLLDPVVVSVDSTNGSFTHLATYRFAGWDVGELAIEMDDVVVSSPTGSAQLTFGSPTVTIVSVLPSDTAEHVPRPAREVFRSALAWWYPWLPLLVMGLLLAAVFAWWWRRRGSPAVVVSTVVHAETALAQVSALRLIEAGERGRFVTLTADVLRDFLCSRFNSLSPAHTSFEISTLLQETGEPLWLRIELLLAQADAAKFANAGVDESAARAFAAEVLAVVREIGGRSPPDPIEEQMGAAA